MGASPCVIGHAPKGLCGVEVSPKVLRFDRAANSVFDSHAKSAEWDVSKVAALSCCGDSHVLLFQSSKGNGFKKSDWVGRGLGERNGREVFECCLHI